jgi:branched-chain amino acid transport system substrate-binding protein
VRKSLGLVLVTLLVVFSFSCLGAQAKDDPIIIGVPTMMTGSGAAQGQDIMEGAIMAVEDINNMYGGIFGRPLKVQFADVGEGRPDVVASAAEELDRAGAVFFTPGAFLGPSNVHVFGTYEQPYIHTTTWREAVEAYLSDPDEYSNVFMLTPDEWTYGPEAFKGMTEYIDYDHPNNKIAAVATELSYNMTVQATALEEARKAGWEVVLDDVAPVGSTDYSSQLARIRKEKPSIVMCNITTVDEGVAFMNQFLEDPTPSLVYIHFIPSMPEFRALLGDNANGLFWQTCVATIPSPEATEWEARYLEKFGREPGAYAAWEYDSIFMWRQAVLDVGSVDDYAALNNWFETLSDHPFKGLCANYHLNPERHEGILGPDKVPMHWFQIQDGKNVLLSLSGAQFGDNEFQVPHWIK